jgi:hypothetical protein
METTTISSMRVKPAPPRQGARRGRSLFSLGVAPITKDVLEQGACPRCRFATRSESIVICGGEALVARFVWLLVAPV